MPLLLVVLVATPLVYASCPSFQGRECAGHGTCVTGEGGSVCQCEDGYQRADCSYANVCPGDCGGNGLCATCDVNVQQGMENRSPCSYTLQVTSYQVTSYQVTSHRVTSHKLPSYQVTSYKLQVISYKFQVTPPSRTPAAPRLHSSLVTCNL